MSDLGRVEWNESVDNWAKELPSRDVGRFVSNEVLYESLRRATGYAEKKRWKGFDPYDGLLSPLGHRFLFGATKPLRLILLQSVKRCPINARPLLGISPAVNPKALALFLSAALRLPRAGTQDQRIDELALALEAEESREPGGGWGYNFPWQGRAFYLPTGTPTVVVTSFAGRAFLDLYATSGLQHPLDLAMKACDFVLKRLNRTEDRTGACLSYSPLDRSVIYNASLLGAHLLVRAGSTAGRLDLVEQARPLITFVLSRQRADGSWPYGEAGYQVWCDSFHSGFVLDALHAYWRVTGDKAAESPLCRGAEFYAKNFFGVDGAPFYFPDRRYPLDIHSAAQGVLTLFQLSDLFPAFREQAERVGGWMMKNLFDRKGFFYYQARRGYRVKTPFMRWSQAWGVRALAELVHRGTEGGSHGLE